MASIITTQSGFTAALSSDESAALAAAQAAYGPTVMDDLITGTLLTWSNQLNLALLNNALADPTTKNAILALAATAKKGK